MSGPQRALKKRLEKRLVEQLRSLRTSTILFDRGEEHESRRMSAAMRILFHTAKAGRKPSLSLIDQLGGFGNKVLSSSRGYGNWMDFLQVVVKPEAATPISTRPMLRQEFHECELEEWWAQEPILKHEGKDYTRSLLIRAMANTDGGAHVDSEVDDFYATLEGGEGVMGLIADLTFEGGVSPYPQGTPQHPDNAHLSLVRQFAHEALNSAAHFGWADPSLWYNVPV